jgi:uncharacterized protein YqeY
MSLIDTLRKDALAAMKAKDSVATTILRLAQSEVQAAEARANRPLSDEEALAVVRKLVKSNEETLAASRSDEAAAATLKREIEILTGLLPKGLSPTELTALLAPVADAIKAAGNDGQAVGVAMKLLKSQGVVAGGHDVAAAVRAIRS